MNKLINDLIKTVNIFPRTDEFPAYLLRIIYNYIIL